MLLAGAGVAMTRMGTAFLPEFHEGSLTVQANTLPGTSLAKSDEIGRRVEQILLAQPEVVATARRTGRAEIRRARPGRRGGGDRRRPAGDGPSARRAAGGAAPWVLDAAGHERHDRPADFAPHRSHAVGHAREHRRQGVRRRPADAAPARRARARRDGRRARRRRPVARAADGHSVRPVRAQPAGDRALRAATRTTWPRRSRPASPARRSGASSTAARRSIWW